jgi:copper(I)-binding protein
MRVFWIGLLLAVAFARGAAAEGVSILDAWARMTPPGAPNGAIYLTVNDSGAPDRLLGASAPVAAMVEVHVSKMVNGVMEMLPAGPMPVTQDKPLVLAPGGYHIMLMGLKQQLKPGDSFPVTLRFEKAGDVTAAVTVRAR